MTLFSFNDDCNTALQITNALLIKTVKTQKFHFPNILHIQSNALDVYMYFLIPVVFSQQVLSFVF